MTSPQVIYLLRWLIRDTFRQALASRIFWIVLGVSGLCLMFCLGVSIEGGENLRPEGDFLYHPRTSAPITGATSDLGRLSLLFGAIQVPLPRDRESGVHMICVILATWVAGGVGLLLTLVWTAGFIPESLHPQNASVLFSKPVPRWLVLLGKFVGVVLFVAFQAAIFFLATWLALGWRTDVWLPGYLAAIPVLVLHFAAIYSFSLLLAVYTRSTVAAVLGAALFWALCLAVNYARHSALALPDLSPQTQPLGSFTQFLMEASYWILPKPGDWIVILEQGLGAPAQMAGLSNLPEFSWVLSHNAFQPDLGIMAALLFTITLVGLAGFELEKADY